MYIYIYIYQKGACICICRYAYVSICMCMALKFQRWLLVFHRKLGRERRRWSDHPRDESDVREFWTHQMGNRKWKYINHQYINHEISWNIMKHHELLFIDVSWIQKSIINSKTCNAIDIHESFGSTRSRSISSTKCISVILGLRPAQVTAYYGVLSISVGPVYMFINPICSKMVQYCLNDNPKSINLSNIL